MNQDLRKYFNYLYSIFLGRNYEYVVIVILIFLIPQIVKAFSCVQEKSTDASVKLIRPQYFEGLFQHWWRMLNLINSLKLCMEIILHSYFISNFKKNCKDLGVFYMCQSVLNLWRCSRLCLALMPLPFTFYKSFFK